MEINVYRLPMNGPEDIRKLDKLVDSGIINPEEVIAIMGKTEGNGCVNDFTRGYTTEVFSNYLSKKLNKTQEEIKNTVAFIMSGGTEGVMSPHATIFTQRMTEAKKGLEKKLVAYSGHTRNFLPEEIGTKTMALEVSNTVSELIKKAKIENLEDVHFVQIKCPLLTSERINDALSRGKNVVTHDTYKSMGYSRGASALGVAIALNEIDNDELKDEDILNDWSKYSNVASTSAGVELLNCEILVMGNSYYSESKFRIGHSVMKDSIDLEAVLESLKNSGLNFDTLPSKEDLEKIVNVFAKAESSSTGVVRGRRTTLLTDSDINHTRHARAVVNGVISSVVGDPMVYVSGGGEHQGPDGGGPIATIIRL